MKLGLSSYLCICCVLGDVCLKAKDKGKQKEKENEKN
jgi:hypothetical protein